MDELLKTVVIIPKVEIVRRFHKNGDYYFETVEGHLYLGDTEIHVMDNIPAGSWKADNERWDEIVDVTISDYQRVLAGETD